MAEFDQSREGASPEVQLIARMRLQRVVFGAFAIVLVCLFALGLSAYRRMQSEKKTAQDDSVAADARATEARKAAENIERELQTARGDLTETRRQLALEKCRLAMREIEDGQLARARALLDEAKQLGPPPWSPLVARLTGDQAVRFSGSKHAASPILGGAMSRDQTRLAVVRAVENGLQVETYDARAGKLLGVQSVDGAAAPPDGVPCRLLLNRDGSAWYMPLQGRAFACNQGRVTALGETPPDYDPARDAVGSLDASPGLDVVYEAHGPRGLLRRTRMLDGHWVSGYVKLDLDNPNVMAVCLAGARPVVLTSTGIYLVGGNGRTGLLQSLDETPSRCALHYGAGAVYAAMLTGRTLDLAAIKTGEQPRIATSRHEMPDDTARDLYFLADDTPVWIGRSGRIVAMNFSNHKQLMLGGYAPAFVERHPQGWVFGNRKGELSVRTDDSYRLLGEPLHMVPPRFVAEPRAHGFVLRAPGADMYVLQDDQVRAIGQVANVVLAPRGPAWNDGHLHLPDGSTSEEEGTLLGAFADGSVLLYAQPQKLKHVTGVGVREFLLDGAGRAPAPVVLAADANVTALRILDSVYVCDLQSEPEAVPSSIEVEPSLLALDATGGALAVAYGPTIVVHDLRKNAEHTVRAGAAPRQVALLFGGSALVTLEANHLLLYEVETGRLLLKTGTDVTGLCASGPASLRLVAGGWMRELDFGTTK